jgi:hypothetical protein
MDRRIFVVAAAWIALGAALGGCGKGDEKFRTQLNPVVARITEQAKGAAALTGGAPAATIERTGAMLTDIAGLGADLKSLYVDGEKQQGLVAAGQAYLSATQRFVTAQQEFARAYARLEAARVKVRESLEAKVRTSKFSMDFWKETHDRLVIDLDNVRKENEKLKDRLLAATAALEQSAAAAGQALGAGVALIDKATLDTHRKALDAVPLAKGA